MECSKRPSRSDDHLSREEEVTLEAETRKHFEGIAPKRHTKPQRSEYSPHYVDDALPSSNGDSDSIPEFAEFQLLENDTSKLVYTGSQMPEEFVETEYYKDLNGVDKQHHTTGTGFIRTMDDADGKNFTLAPDSATSIHLSSRGNPATNDWIPATPDKVTLASDKPRRSEN